jgi:hypothetical protein
MSFLRRNIFHAFKQLEISSLKLFHCEDKLIVLTEKRRNEIKIGKGQRKEGRGVEDEGAEEMILR